MGAGGAQFVRQHQIALERQGVGVVVLQGKKPVGALVFLVGVAGAAKGKGAVVDAVEGVFAPIGGKAVFPALYLLGVGYAYTAVSVAAADGLPVFVFFASVHQPLCARKEKTHLDVGGFVVDVEHGVAARIAAVGRGGGCGGSQNDAGEGGQKFHGGVRIGKTRRRAAGRKKRDFSDKSNFYAKAAP